MTPSFLSSEAKKGKKKVDILSNCDNFFHEIPTNAE